MSTAARCGRAASSSRSASTCATTSSTGWATRASRCGSIHHGVDHGRFTPDGRPREPFLLYPANWWAHKNHELLLQAFALVRRERPELRLVLTGSDHPAALPDGVASLGRVPDEQLVDLYRSASALVFPSLYEGFGLPALEAMACGCPVAVSRVAALPEVCGDAAVYFDPTSVEDIARGIARGARPAPGRRNRARGALHLGRVRTAP